jgi:hypothetical protein
LTVPFFVPLVLLGGHFVRGFWADLRSRCRILARCCALLRIFLLKKSNGANFAANGV